jgi:hypothetical protein
MAIRLVVDLKEHPPKEPECYATRLTVQKGKRWITTDDLPLEARSYGNLTPHPTKKRTDLQEQSFQLIPRQTLPPGEYVVNGSFYVLRAAGDTRAHWEWVGALDFSTFGVAGH